MPVNMAHANEIKYLVCHKWHEIINNVGGNEVFFALLKIIYEMMTWHDMT